MKLCRWRKCAACSPLDRKFKLSAAQCGCGAILTRLQMPRHGKIVPFGQFVVEIRVNFVAPLAAHWGTPCGAAFSKARIVLRARDNLDITVPMGILTSSAISL